MCHCRKLRTSRYVAKGTSIPSFSNRTIPELFTDADYKEPRNSVLNKRTRGLS